MGSKQHKYKNMPVDDSDDNRSSTEVESLMEETKAQWHDVDLDHMQPSRRSRVSRVCGTLNAWRWLIDTTLLVIILGFVVRSYFKEEVVKPYDFGGDITGVGPKCKLSYSTVSVFERLLILQPVSEQITTFVHEEEYAPYNVSEFFRDDVLDKWNKLMPRKPKHPSSTNLRGAPY